MASAERLPLRSRLLRTFTWLALGGGAVTGAVVGYQHERSAAQELRQEIRTMREDVGGFLEFGDYVTNIRTRPPMPNEAPMLDQIDRLTSQAETHERNRELLTLGISATAGITVFGAGYSIARKPSAQHSQ